MSRQFSMLATMPPVPLLPPAADAAGRTSSYRSLKNSQKAYVVAEVNQGASATVAITLLQAKDNQGTASKALNATPVWLIADASVSDALIAQGSMSGFTTSATLKDKLIVFAVLPIEALDINNGYAYLAIQTGASNAANVTEAKLYVQDDYQSAQPASRY